MILILVFILFDSECLVSRLAVKWRSIVRRNNQQSECDMNLWKKIDNAYSRRKFWNHYFFSSKHTHTNTFIFFSYFYKTHNIINLSPWPMWHVCFILPFISQHSTHFTKLNQCYFNFHRPIIFLAQTLSILHAVSRSLSRGDAHFSYNHCIERFSSDKQ